jgi:hypothetical protein
VLLEQVGEVRDDCSQIKLLALINSTSNYVNDLQIPVEAYLREVEVVIELRQ